MRTVLLATIVAFVGAVATVLAGAQTTARFADRGVAFDYPKDWKAKSTESDGLLNIYASNTKGTQVMIQMHAPGTDPKIIRDILDQTFRKQFDGKLVKGSEKAVKRKLVGSVQEGITMEYEVAKGVVTNFELYAFTLPSKKVVFVLFGHFPLYAEGAKKELDLIAASLTEVPVNPVIAQSAFNDKQGGGAEAGWATPWGPASKGAVLQKKVVFEGDGALHLSNTGFTRRLSAPQKGRFAVEQHVQVPAGGAMIAYVRNGDGPAGGGDGPVWRVANGKFFTLKGDGTWLETPFATEAGKWHKVVVTVDIAKQSWELSVDDRKLESPQPLPFRSKQTELDTLRYQCENAPGIFVDMVRVLRAPVGGN